MRHISTKTSLVEHIIGIAACYTRYFYAFAEFTEQDHLRRLFTLLKNTYGWDSASTYKPSQIIYSIAPESIQHQHVSIVVFKSCYLIEINFHWNKLSKKYAYAKRSRIFNVWEAIF